MSNATWGFRVVAVCICCVAFAGCGGGGGGAAPSEMNAEESGLVFTTAVASIDVPPGSKTQDWSINTGTLKSTPIAADPGSSPIEIVSEERQLVWAGNASNRLMMATIKEPGQNDVTLSALSTFGV